MTALADLQAFDVDNADLTLWTFKKQSPKGKAPQYNGHWVDTTEDMDAELKAIINIQRRRLEEQIDYGLLTQNNEASTLHISTDETHFDLVTDEIGSELAKDKVRDVKTLRNCAFYILKLTHGEAVLYCAKKTDSSWKTKTSISTITAIFSDKQLDVVEDSDFKIHKSIDFFGLNDSLLIVEKDSFESILSYKEAHEKDYLEMSEEDDFKKLFSDLGPMTEFVGTNKIHLRRMSAIRQKKFYSNATFMDNLRKNYKSFNLNIVFDEQGRFKPSPDTCRDIVSALLDHRLVSGFSGNIYDVQDAILV